MEAQAHTWGSVRTSCALFHPGMCQTIWALGEVKTGHKRLLEFKKLSLQGVGGAGGVDQFLPPYTALPWESAFGRIDGSSESF